MTFIEWMVEDFKVPGAMTLPMQRRAYFVPKLFSKPLESRLSSGIKTR
jgi:hypothetical protein